MQVPLHHMFHLGRDFFKGKLQEVAASYLGTGDYNLQSQFRSKKRHIDEEKSAKLLGLLGAVPTYRDLIYRLRNGEDVTSYREPDKLIHSDDEEEMEVEEPETEMEIEQCHLRRNK